MISQKFSQRIKLKNLYIQRDYTRSMIIGLMMNMNLISITLIPINGLI